MRFRSVFSTAWFCVVVVLCASCISIGFAQEVKQPAAGGEESSENIDAVLMLDASGSMLITDPHKLRNQGARLFAGSLNDGDRLAIVEFSESTRVIRPLSPFNPKDLDSVSHDIDRIEATGMYTDLLKAVKKGKEMLEVDLRENATQVVVLLSDGKFEPNPKEGSTETLTKHLLDHLVPEARSQGIKFYTLAFSEQADRELLKEIAVGTGGVSWFARTPEEIPQCYSDLFLVVKKPQMVSMTKAGFKIDEDVKEATFYIKKEGNAVLSLLAPDGGIISEGTDNPEVHWFSEENFVVVTVKKPMAGSWQVSGISSPDGFATVLTNLKLVTDWPPSISAGQTYLLQVRLYDAQKPVMIAAMADVVQYSFYITATDRIAEPAAKGPLYDDGTHGDKVAKDGVFSAEVKVDETGDYKLRVMARAPTFERNQQMQFRVKPPFIGLSVYRKEAESQALRTLREMEAGKGKKKGPEPRGEDPNIYMDRDIIRAQLSEDGKALKSPSVNLLATDPDGQEVIIAMKVSRDSQLAYEVDEFGLPKEGRYQLKAVVTGLTRRGKTVQEMTPPMVYEKIKRGGEEYAQVVVVEKERKEKPSSPSKALPISALTLFNLAAGALAFVFLRKAQEGASVTMPVFTPVTIFTDRVESLRRRRGKTEVSFDDPQFAGVIPEGLTADEEIEEKEEGGGQDAPGPEAAAAPEEEAGAESAVQAAAPLSDIDAELNNLLDDTGAESGEEDVESSGEEEEGK